MWRRGDQMEQVQSIVADPVRFAAWWQSREPEHLDRKILEAAIAAHLVVRAAGMISLTSTGKDRRRAGGRKTNA